MKICVIVPTYNESKEIASLIKQIKEQNLEVLIIDDGSVDNTSKIANDNGAIVLKNPRNEGKGASLIKGFNYALSNNFEAVITMDGDGQHLPCDIPNFINLARDSNSKILVGNRMSKAKSMPPLRFFTNKFMSWLISIITKQKIPDTQCGFRLITKDVLTRISLKTTKYETESEILIKAARLGFKIRSVPIQTVYSGEKSQINPFKDTLRFMRFLFRELWIIRC